MTRIEKYQDLRTAITKEIMTNQVAWQQELQLQEYKKQLLLIDKAYFATVFQTTYEELNLLNLENFMMQENYDLVKINDKIQMMTILEVITASLQEKVVGCQQEEVIIADVRQYKTLISELKAKQATFESALKEKITKVSKVVGFLEHKYDLDNLPQNIDICFKQIKLDRAKLQEMNQNLKSEINQKKQNNYIVFFGLLLLLMIVISILVLLFMLE